MSQIDLVNKQVNELKVQSNEIKRLAKLLFEKAFNTYYGEDLSILLESLESCPSLNGDQPTCDGKHDCSCFDDVKKGNRFLKEIQ